MPLVRTLGGPPEKAHAPFPGSPQEGIATIAKSLRRRMWASGRSDGGSIGAGWLRALGGNLVSDDAAAGYRTGRA